MVGFSLHRLSQALTVSGLAAGGLFAALSGGPAGGPVAAVFPPWWDAARAVRAAAEGGAIVRLGLAPFIVLVAPGDTGGRDRLWRAGAWLLLGKNGTAGCGLKSQ
nr:hypothetical protein [uncultured Rhodopila sp.]